MPGKLLKRTIQKALISEKNLNTLEAMLIKDACENGSRRLLPNQRNRILRAFAIKDVGTEGGLKEVLHSKRTSRMDSRSSACRRDLNGAQDRGWNKWQSW